MLLRASSACCASARADFDAVFRKAVQAWCGGCSLQCPAGAPPRLPKRFGAGRVQGRTALHCAREFWLKRASSAGAACANSSFFNSKNAVLPAAGLQAGQGKCCIDCLALLAHRLVKRPPGPTTGNGYAAAFTAQCCRCRKCSSTVPGSRALQPVPCRLHRRCFFCALPARPVALPFCLLFHRS